MEPMLDRVLALLARVEAGEVPLAYVGDRTPAEVYAGNVWYRTPDGWTLVVFNDCNSWDYLDSAISPEGEHLHVWDGPWSDDGGDYEEPIYRLRGYRPEPRAAWERYGIPEWEPSMLGLVGAFLRWRLGMPEKENAPAPCPIPRWREE